MDTSTREEVEWKQVRQSKRIKEQNNSMMSIGEKTNLRKNMTKMKVTKISLKLL